MKDHIRLITDESVSKKKTKMKRIRTILISTIIVCTIIALYFHYVIAIPLSLIVLSIVWYIVPVKNVHVYPEDIRLQLQHRLQDIQEKEKHYHNPDLLIEEDEIKNSLDALWHKENVFGE